ncbi:hypothetical protein WKK05_13960 [Nostoc sp. UHCC 0302]|uniref:hypothetical protein n=1 Tax=Nostoc sp. UHCC 0302 TaxID=3134896 RepID=UPI00311CACD3
MRIFQGEAYQLMSKHQTSLSCREDIGMLPCPLCGHVVFIEKAIATPQSAIAFCNLDFFLTSFQTW